MTCPNCKHEDFQILEEKQHFVIDKIITTIVIICALIVYKIFNTVIFANVIQVICMAVIGLTIICEILVLNSHRKKRVIKVICKHCMEMWFIEKIED